VEWAQPERRAVHVLLAKCDKLNRTEQTALLRESKAILGAAGTVQLFSAHAGTGVDEAQKALVAVLRPQAPKAAPTPTG
jgi:GTP-binding protein EngB required for normal cell division